MRALPDKWNPRLWLRDWLNKPSQAELEERAAGELASRAFFEELSRGSESGSPAVDLSRRRGSARSWKECPAALRPERTV